MLSVNQWAEAIVGVDTSNEKYEYFLKGLNKCLGVEDCPIARNILSPRLWDSLVFEKRWVAVKDYIKYRVAFM